MQRMLQTTLIQGTNADYKRYNRLLKDVEGDSIDTDILDEELRCLQATEPTTCRGRTVRFLESGPLHAVVCFLIVVDVTIVVSEILMDMHTMRNQYTEASKDLNELISFVKETHFDALNRYPGSNIHHMMDRIRQQKSARVETSDGDGNDDGSGGTGAPGDGSGTELCCRACVGRADDRLRGRNKTIDDRLAVDCRAYLEFIRNNSNSRHQEGRTEEAEKNKSESDSNRIEPKFNQDSNKSVQVSKISESAPDSRQKQDNSGPLHQMKTSTPDRDISRTSVTEQSRFLAIPSWDTTPLTPLMKPEFKISEPVSIQSTPPKVVVLISDILTNRGLSDGIKSFTDSGSRLISVSNRYPGVSEHLQDNQLSHTPDSISNENTVELVNPAINGAFQKLKVTSNNLVNNENLKISNASKNNDDGTLTRGPNNGQDMPDLLTSPVTRGRDMSDSFDVDSMNNKSKDAGVRVRRGQPPVDDGDSVAATKNINTLQQIAHVMHYVSIFIVGLFGVQVFVKMYALGCEFYKQKMEVFDAFITLASFTIDLVIVEDVTSVTKGDEAIAVVVIFLLWRVLRLANGLLIAAKQRQEFRIKLQKRGRMRAEKKIEWLESELDRKEREIESLVRLSVDKGASAEEICQCRPKHNFPMLNASAGLSSVASFSLGLSMSMAGPNENPGAALRQSSISNCNSVRRRSFQELFPVRPSALPPSSHSKRIFSRSKDMRRGKVESCSYFVDADLVEETMEDNMDATDVDPDMDGNKRDDGDCEICIGNQTARYLSTSAGSERYLPTSAGNDRYVTTSAGSDRYVTTSAGSDEGRVNETVDCKQPASSNNSTWSHAISINTTLSPLVSPELLTSDECANLFDTSSQDGRCHHGRETSDTGQARLHWSLVRLHVVKYK